MGDLFLSIVRKIFELAKIRIRKVCKYPKSFFPSSFSHIWIKKKKIAAVVEVKKYITLILALNKKSKSWNFLIDPRPSTNQCISLKSGSLFLVMVSVRTYKTHRSKS